MRTKVNLTEAAGFIADLDHVPAAKALTIVSRVRSFDNKSLLHVEREENGRREGRLDVDNVIKAAILSRLIDLGFDFEVLNIVSSALNKRSQVLPNKNVLTTLRGVVAVVNHTAERDHTCDLVISLWHEPATGRKHIGARVFGADPATSGRAADALDNLFTQQAQVIVPLSPLVTSILAFFATDEG